jgi:hypothetical protein
MYDRIFAEPLLTKKGTSQTAGPSQSLGSLSERLEHMLRS